MPAPQQQQRKRRVASCSSRCVAGNANRAYVCKCTTCGGKWHGARSIDAAFLIEVLDRKLTDPELPPGEFEYWMAVVEVAHNKRPRLRRVK